MFMFWVWSALAAFACNSIYNTVFPTTSVAVTTTSDGKVSVTRGRDTVSVETPQQSLLDFAAYQETRIIDYIKDHDAVASLPVDDLEMFAQAACARAANLSDLRAAVQKQVRGKIPDDVYEDIADRAFIDELSDNLIHFTDTSSKITTQGSAYTYLGFVRTLQHRDGSAETCMVVSALRLKAGTMIVGYENSTEQRILYYKKVPCGLFGLKQCTGDPVYTTKTTRFPIIKQAVLSFDDQLRLRKQMIANGVEAAMATASNGKLNAMAKLTEEESEQFAGSWPIISP